MNDPLFDALNATRLKATSQGKTTDLPPSQWIRRELKQFGTLDTPPNYKADLTGIHPFRREAFEIEDERYEALGQSLRLAAKLLNSAKPYLCNFLPRVQVKVSRKSEARVPIDDTNRTLGEQGDASQALLQVLQNITWKEDETMWKMYNALGLTHTGYAEDISEIFDYSGGEESEEVWQVSSEESDKLGLPYRQMTITLATEMVDTIISSAPNTEQHMNAVFQTGITIAHEIGHAIFYCHKEEPAASIWVGDDQFNEIGHSLISWLFGGFYPQAIYIENNKFFREFRGGHSWIKMPRKPSRQPLAEIRYSMLMSHIQKILSAESWAPYDFNNDPDVHIKVRKELLSPQLPFKIGNHARASTILGVYSAWKLRPQYAGYAAEEDVDEVDEEDFYMPTPRVPTFVDEDWDDEGSATEAATREEAAKKRKCVIDLTTESVTRESNRVSRRKLNSSGDYLDTNNPISAVRQGKAAKKRKCVIDLTTESVTRESNRVSRRKLNSSGDYLDTDNPVSAVRQVKAASGRRGTGATARSKKSPRPDERVSSRMQYLLARKYSDAEILVFLTHNPQFLPDPQIRGRVAKPKYTQEEIATYFGKKLGVLPASIDDGRIAAARPRDDGDDVDDKDEEDMEKYAPKKRVPPPKYDSDDEEDKKVIAAGGRIVYPSQIAWDSHKEDLVTNKGTGRMYALGRRVVQPGQIIWGSVEEDVVPNEGALSDKEGVKATATTTKADLAPRRKTSTPSILKRASVPKGRAQPKVWCLD
ncbi:hypothetical protein MMC27_001608 [Xylographa pallens]|nr:hypothetical protein [Xylographa pallens]